MSYNKQKTVAILHGGDNESRRLIQVLVQESSNTDIIFEYIVYEPNQDIESLVMLKLNLYKRQGLPLIVILSLRLLELIWSSSQKSLFLFNITSHVNNNIVHVWVDGIDREWLRKYSTLLCWKNGPFKSITSNELMKGDFSCTVKLKKLFQEPSRSKKSAICVQENRLNYSRYSFDGESTKSLPLTPTDYNDEFDSKCFSLPSNEQLVERDSSVSSNKTNTTNTSKKKKKRNQKKQPNTS